MADRAATVTFPDDDPTTVELLTAVRRGDVDLVRRFLSENPDLARARFGSSRGGTRQAEAWGEKVMAVRTEAGFGDGPPSIEYFEVHRVVQR